MRTKAHHWVDALVSDISFGGSVVFDQSAAIFVDSSADTVDLLVDLGTVMVTLLTRTGNRVGNTGWMPCTNTGNLTETLMGLTWKLLGTPSRGDTFLSVTLVDSDDIDHLVLAEDVLHWHLLLKEVTSKVDLGGDIATVDLDLHQMSLLGFQWQKFHLKISIDLYKSS